MRKLLCYLVLFVSFQSGAQVFHFDDTSAVLIKTVDQSPAHWYLEILNDIGSDTVLRWKSEFYNIPSQWQISLDDQTTYHTDVQDGDSADFVLQSGLEFPQKLIIGGTLNNTPGHGIVYFDIFDPDFPSVVQRVSYEFIISPIAGIEELKADGILVKNGIIQLEDNSSFDVQVVDQNGRIVDQAHTGSYNFSEFKGKNYLLYIRSSSRQSTLWISE